MNQPISNNIGRKDPSQPASSIGEKRASIFKSFFGSSAKGSLERPMIRTSEPAKSSGWRAFFSSGSGPGISKKLNTVEPKKPKLTQKYLKDELYKHSNLTADERSRILNKARQIAGYEVTKDWQRAKVMRELNKDRGFSDVDKKTIKKVFE